MVTILVTGGIGSGKTEVSRILSESGIPVYDSDSAVHRLYRADKALRSSVAEAFGREILTPEGVNRTVLSKIVFSSSASLERLESIVYPALLKDFRSWQNGLDSAYSAMESAIAFEKPVFKDIFDFIIFVDAPEDERIARVCGRDGISSEDVRSRMASQKNLAGGAAGAVIRNDSGLENLRRQVESTLNSLYLQFGNK
ncbi:MAG: dephospho-CoA kinase [Bacteroidales bacterium]|nr:dephospho-CoA kinase [Bacteroidales bacterium]